jgi:DNA mismatch endonuclease (patch repair protein)
MPKFGVAVFVHGCFWHGHGCKRSHLPSTNIAFWTQKIARNVERDAATQKALRHEGWTVVVVWQCRLQRDLNLLLGCLMRQRA